MASELTVSAGGDDTPPPNSGPVRRFRRRTYLLGVALAGSTWGLAAIPMQHEFAVANRLSSVPPLPPPPLPTPMTVPPRVPLVPYRGPEYLQLATPTFLVEPGREPTFRMSGVENNALVVDTSRPEPELFLVGSGTPSGSGVASAEAYRAFPGGWERIPTDLTAVPIPSAYDRGVSDAGRLLLGGFVGSRLMQRPLLTTVGPGGQSKTFVGDESGAISSLAMLDGRGLAVILGEKGGTLVREAPDGTWSVLRESTPKSVFTQVAVANGTVVLLGVTVTPGGNVTSVWTTTDLVRFQEMALEPLPFGADGSDLRVSPEGFSIRTYEGDGATGWESRDGVTWSVADSPDTVGGVRIVHDGDAVRIQTPDATAPRARSTLLGRDPVSIDTVTAITTATSGAQFAAVEWRDHRALMFAESPGAAFRQLPTAGLPRRRLDRYRRVSSLAAIPGLAMAVVDSAPKTPEGIRQDPDAREVWIKQGDQSWRKMSESEYRGPDWPWFLQTYGDGLLVLTALGYKVTTDGSTFSDLALPAGEVLRVRSDRFGAVAILRSGASFALATDSNDHVWTERAIPNETEAGRAVDLCFSEDRLGFVTAEGRLWLQPRKATPGAQWVSVDLRLPEDVAATSCSITASQAFVSTSLPEKDATYGYLVDLTPPTPTVSTATVNFPSGIADKAIQLYLPTRSGRFLALGSIETGTEAGDAVVWSFDLHSSEPFVRMAYQSPELDSFAAVALLPQESLIAGESNDAPAIWSGPPM